MSVSGLWDVWQVNPGSGVALPPHWGWYVIAYFFLGGLAGGLYFIATLFDLVGDARDRAAARIGYLVAFPLMLICGLLLVVDLGVPLRFWHMLIQSNRPPLPMLKPWSPISLGSWILTVFGLVSFISFLGSLAEIGRLRGRLGSWLATARERLPRPVVLVWHMVGVLAGFGLAGYTGVLVTGSSVAVWHNARMLGALFLISAASTSYALLILLLVRGGRRHDDTTVSKLASADRWALALELIVIASMLALLGRLAAPFITGGFGVVFWVGVVLIGLLVPLALSLGVRWPPEAERRAVVSAACVLVGGLLLRFVIVMSPQWPRVPPWYL
jgi:formate-dependent nitrite reductase membrane component NrfD